MLLEKLVKVIGKRKYSEKQIIGLRQIFDERQHSNLKISLD